MIPWLIFGGVLLIGLIAGGIAGYKYCQRLNNKIMQALYNGGYAIYKTEDGWSGVDSAFQEIVWQKSQEAIK